MVKIKFWTTALLALTFVISGLISAVPAAASVPQAPGYVHCSVKANNPHESHGSPGWLVGKSQFWCSAKIDSLVNSVKLQKRVKGKWVDAAAPKNREIGSPEAGHKYTNQTLNYKCEKGTFRTASRGHGIYHSTPSKSAAWE
ncbi:MAG: hypothetical protein ACRD3Q_13080, partial [Terriglobales bacterium]